MRLRPPLQLEMKAMLEARVRPATAPGRTWGGKRAGAGRPRTVATNNATLTKMVAQPDGRLLLLGRSDDKFDGVIARIWP